MGQMANEVACFYLYLYSECFSYDNRNSI